MLKAQPLQNGPIFGIAAIEDFVKALAVITQSEIDTAQAERRASYDSNGDSELNLQELTA